MNEPTPKVDPAATGRPLYDEADIGSGEKSPGEKETEEMIREIPPLPASGGQSETPSKEARQPGA
ncbi:hypothetical protein [Telluria aromaticivorans]|uniref:Uncharacterized protein n=1 Tax=Telluria aromaticivorans TaxID=2725995 RepID=A0A7Y2JZN0_9BURK|nr:hypothetical protein [Telluria aromaticivorans]NNG23455.1 hypothetical protein [Telluria aromaticivorans]